MTVLGTMDLRAWDTGVFLTLDGELVSYVVDGATRQSYAVAVPGLESGLPNLGDRVPLYFDVPEDVYQPYVLPNITVRRNDLTPGYDRHPWYQWVGRRPARGAQEVVLPDGTRGYTKYENQFRAAQFDIGYDLLLNARRRVDANLMLVYVLRRMQPPWFVFRAIDSLGEVRQYDAGEMTISNTSELSNVAERSVGHTISFTVRAEIDLHDVRIEPAVLAVSPTYAKYRP